MIKEYLYDWHGINQQIFLTINKFFSSLGPDFFINLFDQLAAITNFYFYLLLILLIKAYYIMKYKNDRNLLHLNLFKWSEIFFIASLAFVINMLIAGILKYSLKFTRPFCHEQIKDIYVIKHSAEYNCQTSFPSGHTMVATILVTAFWPSLNIYGKILSIALIVITALSRISAGLHFPADLLFGFIIAFSITYISRKLFKKRFVIIYNYLKNKIF